jgi:hypothetical protein
MPKLGVTVTATTKTEVKITPTLKRQLLTELKGYAELKAQRDAIDATMKDSRATVEGLMEKVGETSLSVEGFKTTLIAPKRSHLDVKELVKLGVSTEIIKKATIETTGTPYIKISVPGGRNQQEDE